MTADRYIAQGLIDASDVYDIPAIDSVATLRFVKLPDTNGLWLSYPDDYVGPFNTIADAKEFNAEVSLDDPIEPLDPDTALLFRIETHSETITFYPTPLGEKEEA